LRALQRRPRRPYLDQLLELFLGAESIMAASIFRDGRTAGSAS
jgi:hypothetical protein